MTAGWQGISVKTSVHAWIIVIRITPLESLSLSGYEGSNLCLSRIDSEVRDTRNVDQRCGPYDDKHEVWPQKD